MKYSQRYSKFFDDIIIFTDVFNSMIFMLKEGEDFDQRIINFLSLADPGVVSHAVNENKAANSDVARSLMKDIEGVFKKHVASFNTNFEMDNLKELRLGHRNFDGEATFLPFDTESRGTQRVIALLGPIYEALGAGKIVAIDEFDASLHTYVCSEIVRLFANKLDNSMGAQLIATTHDTNLLAQDQIRRDEVWIVEKDKRGASIVYPLTDFKTKQSDNIERGYLRGRYGGVPSKLRN